MNLEAFGGTAVRKWTRLRHAVRIISNVRRRNFGIEGLGAYPQLNRIRNFTFLVMLLDTAQVVGFENGENSNSASV